MDSRLNNFVKAILDLCFYFGIVAIATAPLYLKYAVNLAIYTLGESTEYSAINDHYGYAVVSIMIAGTAALLIL